ncbi:MAG: nitroreductase family protein [Candidatus Lokiarchaeota archaeon]|nr:nitroreductase family protein [Candidatus Lokiarchaeota archaeon]
MINPEEFLKFLKERRSIRSFLDKEIPDKEIEMILEAGRWAPSASNKQPWEFIVIKDKEFKLKVSKTAAYGRFMKQAPVLIAIIGKTRISPKWYIIDTSLVTMNMMLMAWSLGPIGTCWIGSMNRERARDILKLSETDYVATILPFGYPEGEIPSPTARKSKEKLVKEI